MRAPLCLLLLVAHAVDMLPLNRRKKQGMRGSRQDGRAVAAPERHLDLQTQSLLPLNTTISYVPLPGPWEAWHRLDGELSWDRL